MKGRTGYQMGEIIQKELNEGVKTGKELRRLVIEKLGSDSPKHFDKAYDGALIKLLEGEDIKIVGYDPSKDFRKTKQAFKSDPLVFDSSNRLTRPDIQNLLKEFTTSNKAYQQIRTLFKVKLEELKTFYSSRWAFLEKGTFCENPDGIEYQFSEFNFYYEIIDMIEDLTTEEKEGYLRYHFMEEKDEDVDFYDNVWYRIHNIIDDVGVKMIEREEIQEKKEEIKERQQEKKDMFPEPGNIDDAKEFYTEDEYLDEKDEYFVEDEYSIGDLEEIIEWLSSLLIYLDKYKKYEGLKVWFYPATNFDFNDIWVDLRSNFFNIHPYLDVEMIQSHDYSFSIDKYGYWDKKKALEEARFENRPETIENLDAAFERVIDIISTYPEEEMNILMGILAKGLSDESGSIKVFAEFFKKMSSVYYPQRLNNVLGIVSEHTETVSYDEFKTVKGDLERVKQLDRMKREK